MNVKQKFALLMFTMKSASRSPARGHPILIGLWSITAVFVFCVSCDSTEDRNDEGGSKTDSDRDTSSSSLSPGASSPQRSFEGDEGDLAEILSSSDWMLKFDYLAENWSDLSADEREKFYHVLSVQLDGETNFDFDTIWPTLVKIPQDSLSGRGLRYKAITLASRAGTVGNVHEKVSESFGPGTNRNWLIRALFSGDPRFPFNLDEIAQEFEKLEFKDEREAARNGLSYHLASAADIELLSSFLTSGNSEIREIAAYAAALYPNTRYTENSEDFEARLGTAMEVASSFSDADRESFVDNLVQRTDHTDQAFSVYDFLTSSTENDFSVDLGKKELSKLARVMVRGKPELAIEKAVSQQADPRFLTEVVSSWIRRDVNATFEWYEESRPSLNVSQKDHVAYAFANEAISNGDDETAQVWAEQIDGELMREEILEMIPAK